MPLISNVGGSITGALALLATAFSVRLMRLRHRAKQVTGGGCLQPHDVASISVAALRILVETQPVPHAVVVMKGAADADTCRWLQCRDAAVLAVEELPAAMKSAQAWESCVRSQGSPAQPTPRHQLLVVVADSDAAARQAAGIVAACGHHCCLSVTVPPSMVRDGSSGTAHQVEYLSRDALACLLQHGALSSGGGETGTQPATFLIDVRRHDERTLYGSIPGSVHLPVDGLARAFSQLDGQAFAAAYSFSKPSPSAALILISRTTRRAVWASQLCRDAGFHRVYVSQHGTYGWHMDGSVKPYRRYELGDAPPDPDALEPDAVDVLAGELELHRLGLAIA